MLNRSVGAAVAFAIACALVVVFLALLPSTPSQELDGAGELTSGQQPTDPCGHLDGQIVGFSGNLGHLVTYVITDYVSSVHAVAAVTVANILTGRFNTASGSPPPPTSTPASPTATPTGEWWDDVDMPLPPPPMVFEPVILQARKVYSGAQVDGYITMRHGGTSPCSGYTYRVDSPEVLTATEGTTGIAMLRFPERDWDWANNPPAHAAQLIEIMENLNGAGGNYTVTLPFGWWWYHDGYAHTDMPTPDEPLTISAFESLVESLLTP